MRGNSASDRPDLCTAWCSAVQDITPVKDVVISVETDLVSEQTHQPELLPNVHGPRREVHTVLEDVLHFRFGCVHFHPDIVRDQFDRPTGSAYRRKKSYAKQYKETMKAP